MTISSSHAPMVTLPGNGSDVYGANYNKMLHAWTVSTDAEGRTRYRLVTSRPERASQPAAKVRRQAKRAERHDVAAEIAAWMTEHADEIADDLDALLTLEEGIHEGELDEFCALAAVEQQDDVFEHIARWVDTGEDLDEAEHEAWTDAGWGDRLDHDDWKRHGFIVRARF